VRHREELIHGCAGESFAGASEQGQQIAEIERAVLVAEAVELTLFGARQR